MLGVIHLLVLVPLTFSQTKIETNVVIGGAGFGGIGAANELSKHGVDDFLIVEATEKIGGRVRCEKFGSKKYGFYTMELGANWISGSKGNPIFELKRATKLKGFNQWFTMALYNEKGEKVLGDYETDWDTLKGQKVNTRGRISDAAYWETVPLAKNCLQLSKGTVLNSTHQKYCNSLCLGLVDGDTFDELTITDRTICNDKGEFVAGELPKEVDMSITDLQRATSYALFPPTEDDVCVARLADTFYWDSDLGTAPWKVSATASYGVHTWLEFESAEWYVLDDRCFSFLTEYLASTFLSTSVNTRKKIKINDSRLMFNTKVLKVNWDPTGKKKVKIVACKTKKQTVENSPHLYPCVNEDRIEITANEFISTFSFGVMQKSMQEEIDGVPISESEDTAPRFNPPLMSIPSFKKPLTLNNMVGYSKAYFQFEFEFWPPKEFLFTPWTQDGFKCDYAPQWQVLGLKNYYPGSNIIFLYTFGDRTHHLAGMTDEDAIVSLLPVLNKYFADKIKTGLAKLGKGRNELIREDVVAFKIQRWSSDPLFQGCWETAGLGSTKEMMDDYAKWHGNLVLTGDSTCPRHSGYTHGAKFAGERSAKVLLKERYGMSDIDTRTLCNYDPVQLKTPLTPAPTKKAKKTKKEPKKPKRKSKTPKRKSKKQPKKKLGRFE